MKLLFGSADTIRIVVADSPFSLKSIRAVIGYLSDRNCRAVAFGKFLYRSCAFVVRFHSDEMQLNPAIEWKDSR